MTTKIAPLSSVIPEATKTGTKAARQEAYYRVVDSISQIINIQNNFLRRLPEGSGYDATHEIRLYAYDKFVPQLADEIFRLGEVLDLKHAGGRPSMLDKDGGQLFDLAYKLLKSNYKETEKIYQTKELVRAVKKYLEGQHKLIDGSKQSDNPQGGISNYEAKEVIQLFKDCLTNKNSMETS
jgi:hypothetical protein